MSGAWWGLIAAVPAVGAEYLYRTLPGPWHVNLHIWIPIQLSIGYCIYRIVTVPHTTLLDAFVIWMFSTTVLRIFVSVVVLDETIRAGTWAALVLIVLARAIQTFWR